MDNEASDCVPSVQYVWAPTSIYVLQRLANCVVATKTVLKPSRNSVCLGPWRRSTAATGHNGWDCRPCGPSAQYGRPLCGNIRAFIPEVIKETSALLLYIERVFHLKIILASKILRLLQHNLWQHFRSVYDAENCHEQCSVKLRFSEDIWR